jgi:ketosteroid isomerase-like protein
MRDLWRDFLAQWQGYRAVAEDYRELDGERVLVLTRAAGHGKASGLPLNQPNAATLLHVCDGKVTRLVFYNGRERAFADLGLEPEGGSP